MQKAVLDVLGAEGCRSLLALEELQNDISADREERYFDLGYERGVADGRARERRGGRPLPKAAVRLVDDVRERILRTRPRRHALLGLLECLNELVMRRCARRKRWTRECDRLDGRFAARPRDADRLGSSARTVETSSRRRRRPPYRPRGSAQ